MPRRPATPEIEAYRLTIQKWMPAAEIRTEGEAPGEARHRFDGVITWTTPQGPVRYLVEEKRHLRHQDAGVIVDQLQRRRATLPAGNRADRILLLAPHVRAQQAALLERADIDYLDLAGNAHLHAPGLFVHVEGHRPAKEATTAPVRPQKGWVKAVMAILIRPELAAAPYRTLAEQADVALGTVAGCITDLLARGLLHEGQQGRWVADRPALVALWVQAYVEALRPKLKERRFQVRADTKQALWERLNRVLAHEKAAWALTGADAAGRRTPYLRTEDTEVYAPLRMMEYPAIQAALVAQPAARGGNLLVIEPPGPLAMPTELINGFPFAPDLLAYAELRYRGTGQALEAAELLLPHLMGHGHP